MTGGIEPDAVEADLAAVRELWREVDGMTKEIGRRAARMISTPTKCLPTSLSSITGSAGK